MEPEERLLLSVVLSFGILEVKTETLQSLKRKLDDIEKEINEGNEKIEILSNDLLQKQETSFDAMPIHAVDISLSLPLHVVL